MTHRQPTPDVLAGFGLDGTPTRLPGGQGQAYLCGNIVLKPIDLIEEAEWVADTLSDVNELGFRVERPVRAREGWIVDGWSAWQRLDGEHDSLQRWDEVLRVCDAFHQQLATLPRPPFIDLRDNPWAIGDRVAWDDHPMDGLDDLRARLEPLDLPSQVVHADMPRNVLFADGLEPAVIDFSAYYRPVGFASAVVVADALAWYGADSSVLDLVAHVPHIDQLLLRAVILRLATTIAMFPDDTDRQRADRAAYASVIDLEDLRQ